MQIPLLILNRMSLRVIFLFMKYLTIPDSVAKQKKNQHILLLLHYAAIRGEKIALKFIINKVAILIPFLTVGIIKLYLADIFPISGIIKKCVARFYTVVI